MWAFIRGDSNQEFAAFGIFIAICAFLVSHDDGHNWRVDHINPVARTAHVVLAND